MRNMEPDPSYLVANSRLEREMKAMDENGNPNFCGAREKYAKGYNHLARRLKEVRIPLALLCEVLEAAQEVERVPLGMPTTEFRVAQDNYAMRFNHLAEKMEKAGLSPRLLRNAVNAALAVQLLQNNNLPVQRDIIAEITKFLNENGPQPVRKVYDRLATRFSLSATMKGCAYPDGSNKMEAKVRAAYHQMKRHGRIKSVSWGVWALAN